MSVSISNTTPKKAKVLKRVLGGATAALLSVGGLALAAAPAQAASQCTTVGQYQWTPGGGGPYYSDVPYGGGSSGCLMQQGLVISGGSITTNPVKALQSHLNYCYGAGLTVDGNYGSGTATAVKKVQTQAGFSTVDGKYGPATRQVMKFIVRNAGSGSYAGWCTSGVDPNSAPPAPTDTP